MESRNNKHVNPVDIHVGGAWPDNPDNLNEDGMYSKVSETSIDRIN